MAEPINPVHKNSTATSMPIADALDPRLPRLANIPSFVEYMGTGWGTPDRQAPVEPGMAAAAAEHRLRLSEVFPGHPLVVLSGRAPVRSNDSYYLFRPDSNFFWLTGCDVEDAVIVLTPTANGHDSVIYIPAPAYPGEAAFFADAVHGELWVGGAPGMSEWSEALGTKVRPLASLQADLDGASTSERLLLTGTLNSEIPALRNTPLSTELGRVMAELRMIKGDWEIEELQRAVDASVAGFAEVIRELPRAIEGGGERWLQGTFDRHARTHGHGPGYSTIVGSGRHAPTLHWVRCDGPVLRDELLLLDMGVENRTFYTADVTRTFPASGVFSSTQKDVHDLVEKSHRAGLAAVGPGRDWADFHVASMEVLAQGLHDWGILPVSVDEALSPTGQHHRRYIVCGVGHHLGLDVHDCAQSSYAAYQGATMREGMVITVEPGLYFHEFDETLPPELRGIGVRLEDDVVITATGSRNMSAALPIDAAGIERWMREQQSLAI